MTVAHLLRRRSRAHTGLLLLVLVLTALTGAAIAGSIGYLTVAAREGVRSSLDDAGPRAAAVEVHTRMAADPVAQQQAADAVLDGVLGDLPVVVHRSARSVTLAATGADGSPLGGVVLGSDDELSGLVRMVDGAWPAAVDAAVDGAAVGAAVQADAAATLGLRVGDRLSVAARDEVPVPIEVVALWVPLDADDPVWFGDPLVAAGVDGAETPAHGPFVVPAGALADLAGVRLVRWTMVADLDRLEPHDLPAVREAVAAAAVALDDDEAVDFRGLVATGDLGPTLQGIETTVAGARGATTSAVLMVVLAALVAVSQVARLLGTVRGTEVTVLRSRGSSVTQLGVAAALEGAVVAAVGAGLGSALAGAVLASLGRPQVGPLLWTAVAVAVAAVALLAAVGAVRARAVTALGRSDVAGRRTTALARWLPAVVGLAAVLAWWQLVRYGSPVFVGVDGRAHADPLAVAAVPLALAAVGLALAALLGPVTAAAARRAERTRGLGRSLTLRQLARRAPLHAIPVLLVALTAATCSFVATYAGTWQAYRVALAQAENGADVRVDVAGDAPVRPGGTALAAPYRQIPGADVAVPVRVTGLTSGSADGTFVAVPATGLGPVLLTAPGEDRPATVLAPEDDPRPAPVPAGTSGLTLEVLVARADGRTDLPVGARVWLADPDEDLVLVDAGPAVPLDGVEGRAGYRWTVPMPAGSGDPVTWRVLAVDLVPTSVTPMVVGLVGLHPAEDPALDLRGDAGAAGWTGLVFGTDGPLVLPGSDDGFSVDDLAVRAATSRSVPSPIRLVPGAATARHLPVVASEAWATGLDLSEGATTTIRLAGRALEVEVVGTVTVVPGTGAGVAALAELGATNDALLRTGADVPRVEEVWLAAGRPGGVAAAAREVAGTVTATAAVPGPDPVSSPTVVGFWVAAVAVLLLAVPGLAAAALAVAGSRRGELAVLRALGVGAAQQARLRRAELGWVSAGALALGAAGGLLVGWLCAGILVRASTAVTSPVPVRLTPDVPDGVGLLAATAVALVAVTAGYGAHVAGQARRATGREAAP